MSSGAFTLGMVAGVTSYREKCFEKIMSLDNSRLADEVRRFQQRFVLTPGYFANISSCEIALEIVFFLFNCGIFP